MDIGTAGVVAATITAVGGVIVAGIQSSKKEAREARKENKDDHAVVQAQLGMIYRSVTRVDDKLEKHLIQHREGQDGEVVKRDKAGKA
jgi:hypothetical protein